MWSLGILAENIFTTVLLVDSSWLPLLTAYFLVFGCLILCAKKRKKKPVHDHKTKSFMALPDIPNAAAMSVDPSKESKEPSKKKETQSEKKDDREEQKELPAKPNEKPRSKKVAKETEDSKDDEKKKSEKVSVEVAQTQPDGSKKKEKDDVKKLDETQTLTKSKEQKDKVKTGDEKTEERKEEKKEEKKEETKEETKEDKKKEEMTESKDGKKDETKEEEKKEEKNESKEEKKEKEDKKQDDFEVSVPDIQWEHEEGQATFKITNCSGRHQAYKIKTSNAEVYSVLPVRGILADNESAVVTVVRSKGPFKTDHLAIVFCEANETDTGSAEVFQRGPKSQQHKMIPMLKK